MQDEHVVQCILIGALHLRALRDFCLQSFQCPSSNSREINRRVNNHQQQFSNCFTIIYTAIFMRVDSMGVGLIKRLEWAREERILGGMS
jgi:hypothetical protein